MALQCVAAAARLHIPHHCTAICCNRYSCAAVWCHADGMHLACVILVIQLGRSMQIPHSCCAVLRACDGKPAGMPLSFPVQVGPKAILWKALKCVVQLQQGLRHPEQSTKHTQWQRERRVLLENSSLSTPDRSRKLDSCLQMQVHQVPKQK